MITVGLVPAIFFVMYMGLALITMTLAAASVSTGLFVTVATLTAWWISCLRYGALARISYVVPGVWVVMIGVLAVALQRVVTDGIQVTIDPQLFLGGGGGALDIPALALVPADLLPYLALVEQAVMAFVQGLLQQNAQPISVVVPSGPFQGHTIDLMLNSDSYIQIQLNVGGLTLLKLFWTESGVDNTLAVMQNFMVVFAWSMLCVLVSPLLPLPWRTLRYDLTAKLLPSSLRNAAAYMRSLLVITPSDDGSIEQDDKKKNASTAAISVDQLVEQANIMHGGGVAVVTSLEPRPLACHAPTAAWLKLRSLTICVDRAIMSAVVAECFEPLHSQPRRLILTQAADMYEHCAEAVEHCQPRIVVSSSLDNVTTASPNEDDKHTPADQFLGAFVQELAQATDEWVESMHGHKQQSVSTTANNSFLNVVPFAAGGLAVCVRLVEVLLLPLLVLKGKRRFDHQKFFHGTKFAAGFAALLCMSVYWDAYRDFRTSDDEEDIANGFITYTELVPQSFAGWNLIAYSFATMATTEGTIKKCGFRICGTLLGGFSAWAALTVSADNEYGMIAWLTIVTFVASFFAIDNTAMKSREGSSEDYGYGGFYVILTQSVIVFEYAGLGGSINNRVASRIVANLVGISVAVIMAVIPPNVHGGDPHHAVFMMDEVRKGCVQFIGLLLRAEADGQSILDLDQRVSSATSTERTETVYLLADAERFSKFPIYKVDPTLGETVARTTISASFLSAVMSSTVLKMQTDGSDWLRTDTCREALESIRERIERGSGASKESTDWHEMEEGGILLHALESIEDRLADHQKALDNVQWGWRANS